MNILSKRHSLHTHAPILRSQPAHTAVYLSVMPPSRLLTAPSHRPSVRLRLSHRLLTVRLTVRPSDRLLTVRPSVCPSRPARYHSLEASGLARLPLSQLAADGALVAVWCTNSTAHRRTLSDTLLPAWGVQQCAVWHWVKVGQMTCGVRALRVRVEGGEGS